MGGRALLKRRNGAWSVELCAGDGIKSEGVLSLAGISPEQARKILAELNEEERGMPPKRLQLIASFRGVVHMGPEARQAGENTNHPDGTATDEHATHAPQQAP